MNHYAYYNWIGNIDFDMDVVLIGSDPRTFGSRRKKVRNTKKKNKRKR